MLQHALALARQGWRIFPLHTPGPSGCSCRSPKCESPGKHPRILEWQKQATTDEEKITEWWTLYPDANIGLATGEVAVVDVDDKELALSSIEALEQCKTISVETGKGYHYYFKAPDFPLGNRAKFLPGIDLRAEGGYVVAPPSLHYSGHRYAWRNSPDDYSLQELPEFILYALADTTKKETTRAEGDKILEGGRDNALASLGGTMRKTGCGYLSILAALEARNREACIPPLTQEDVERIARSVSRYQTGDEKNHDLIVAGSEIWEWMKPKEEEKKQSFPISKYGDIGIKIPSWIVKGLLEDNSFILFFGAAGSGKSYAAIDVASCIASGNPFAGHEVKKQGAVIYIAGEGYNGISRRFRAWELKHSVSLKDAPLYISHSACALGDPALMKNVTDTLDNIPEEKALIIIDTWARNMVGDENSTQDTGNAIREIDALKRKYQCSVLVIHHSGLMDSDRARGSSALKGAIDAEYKVSCADDIVTLTNTRMKDAEVPEPMSFAFESIDLGVVDEDGGIVYSYALEPIEIENITNSVIKLSETQALIYDELSKKVDGMKKAEIVHLVESTGKRRNAAYKAMTELSKKGKIRSENGVVFACIPKCIPGIHAS